MKNLLLASILTCFLYGVSNAQTVVCRNSDNAVVEIGYSDMSRYPADSYYQFKSKQKEMFSIDLDNLVGDPKKKILILKSAAEIGSIAKQKKTRKLVRRLVGLEQKKDAIRKLKIENPELLSELASYESQVDSQAEVLSVELGAQ